ncbi:MAG TPA: OmpH family outer membrane protein [Cytophagales bacterium]|nr:OmpH family outer membrane protein [Cytophagales bacterium]
MNNKFLLGYSIVLTIAVGILFYRVFSNSQSGTERNFTQKKLVTDSSQTSGTLPLAYINTDSLSEKYLYFKEYRKQMEAEGRALESSHENRVENWRKKAMDFEKNGPMMSQEQAEQKRYDLEVERENILKDHDAKTKVLMDKTEQQNKKILDVIHSYIKEYNKDGKYKYIFSYVKNGPLLYADEATDITADIVKGLNDKYADSKKQ